MVTRLKSDSYWGVPPPLSSFNPYKNVGSQGESLTYNVGNKSFLPPEIVKILLVGRQSYLPTNIFGGRQLKQLLTVVADAESFGMVSLSLPQSQSPRRGGPSSVPPPPLAPPFRL